MKTLLIAPVLCFVLNTSIGQITFHKTYGGMGQDHTTCIRQTTDGGYIAAGFTPGIGTSGSGGYIVKTDPNGDTLWTRIFGGNYMDNAGQVQQTADGGYIISGTSAYNPGSSDISLIKTDASGNITWNKRYNASQGDFGYSVFQTFDGGYILAGNANYSAGFFSDICLIKTDASGNITWSKITGGTADDFCRSVIQTSDSGYVITGWTTGFGGVIPTIFIAKYNTAGILQWMKTYKENSGNIVTGYGFTVQQTSDEGFIVIGNRENNGVPGTWLLKTDASGTLLWNKSYSGNYKDISRSVCQTTDGGYIIGMSVLNTAVDFDICLIKTDSSGNVSWGKLYGDSADENVYSVRQTNDGGYIIGGDKFSASNDFDLYFIKTDVNGNSGCFENNFSPVTATVPVQVTMQSPVDSSGFTVFAPFLTVDYGGDVHTLCNTMGMEEQVINNTILLYPNPSHGRFIVHTDDSDSQLVIMSMYGQVIFDCRLIKNETEIDLSSRPPGIYFCAFISKNKQNSTVKLVLE
jgi:hypothetical protein